MRKIFKKEAEGWQESYEQFIELMTLGSLLYKEDENGNRTWVKRLDKDVEFEVPPVKIKK